MTKTQISILRLKRGAPVGFVTKSGIVRSLGHVNALPKELRAKLGTKKKGGQQ